MNNVWRLGSNWGGTDIFRIILDSKVGFYANGTDDVAIGDYVAVAAYHSYEVAAVGIVASKVQPLSELLTDDEKFGPLREWVVNAKGFRLSVVAEIPIDERFQTRNYLQFYSLRNDQSAWKKTIEAVHNALERGKMSNFAKLLEGCKNLILTGAPGTGKTYLAQQIAQWMTIGRVVDDAHPATDKERRTLKDHVGFVQFHPSYDYSDFVEGLRPIKCEDSEAVGFERQDGVFKAFCKQAVQNISSNFDEKYDEFSEMMSEKHASAEDALQLNTPNGTPFKVFLNSRRSLSLITGDGSKVQGSLTPEKLRTFLTATPYKYWAIYFKGVIKYLKGKHGLKVAQSNADCPYVFIIDEINRGDLSKIFGELFYSIDPGYRVKHGANADVVKVQTRYANMIEDGDVFKDGFYIPDNVYIIGTMNDIDRSVESMDFAIRRRFTWKKIPADETRLAVVWGTDDSTASVTLEDVKPRYRELNKAIEECASDGLGEAFMIGPSYYLKLKGMGMGKDDCFKTLWDLHLEPLLQEYVRGLPNALELMEKFENAYRLERTDAAAAS